MTWIAVMFTLSSYCLLLGFITFLLKNDELKSLKAMFFLLLVVNTLLMPMFTYIIATGAVDTFKPVAIGYITTNGIIMLVFTYFYIVHLLQNVFNRGEDDS